MKTRPLAVVEADLPGEALEEGALAGAVRADQAAQLAVAQREVDVVDRLHAAEAHRQVARVEHRLAHGRVSAMRRAGAACCVACRRLTLAPASRRSRQRVERRQQAARQQQHDEDRIAPSTSELSISVCWPSSSFR